MGAANTPAYRGTAYVVFEERRSRPTATACRSCPSRSSGRSLIPIRPRAGQGGDDDPRLGRVHLCDRGCPQDRGRHDHVFGQTTGGTTSAENLNALPDEADIVVALDRLQAMAPAVESVSLVVACSAMTCGRATAPSSRRRSDGQGYRPEGLVREWRGAVNAQSGQP